jgi:hypothetical protein
MEGGVLRIGIGEGSCSCADTSDFGERARKCAEFALDCLPIYMG